MSDAVKVFSPCLLMMSTPYDKWMCFSIELCYNLKRLLFLHASSTDTSFLYSILVFSSLENLKFRSLYGAWAASDPSIGVMR